MPRKKKIETDFKSLIDYLGGGEFVEEVGYFETGVKALDLIVGGYGIPHGSILEIFGRWSAGKTYISLYMLKSAIQQGYTPIYFDIEGAVKQSMLRSIGVSTDELIYFPSEKAPRMTVEATFETIKKIFTQSGGRKFIIIIDSIATLMPEVSTEDIFKGRIGQIRAYLLSLALPGIRPLIRITNSILIMNNQVRKGDLGYDSESPGGNALKHLVDVRIEFKPTRLWKDIKKIRTSTGVSLKMVTKKNRFQIFPIEAVVQLLNREPFNPYSGLYEMLVRYGIITTSGSTFKFKTKDRPITQLPQWFEKKKEKLLKIWEDKVGYTGGEIITG